MTEAVGFQRLLQLCRSALATAVHAMEGLHGGQWFQLTVGDGVVRSAPRQFLRRGQALLPGLRFSMGQARSDAAGTIVIGVPVLVGGALLLFFLYWFFFLREQASDSISESAVDSEIERADPEAATVPATEAEAERAQHVPALWAEHMKYRESKSFVLPHEPQDPANRAFGCGGSSGPLGGPPGEEQPLVVPVYRKMNSNFLPASSSTGGEEPKAKTPKPKRRSKKRSGSIGTSHSNSGGLGGSRDSLRTPSPPPAGLYDPSPPRSSTPPPRASTGRGTMSFTEAIMNGTSTISTPSTQQRRKSRNYQTLPSTGGNFFDVRMHPDERPRPGPHRRRHSDSSELSSTPPTRSSSDIAPSEPKRPTTPVRAEKARPAAVEFFLGESAQDRAKLKEDAKRLEEGLRSLSLVVDLEECPPGDFRKTYAILADVEGGETKGGSAAGGVSGIFGFGSFVSFSKTGAGEQKKKSPTNAAGAAKKEERKRNGEATPGKSSGQSRADAEMAAVLKECTPAELVRAIERMRAEIDKRRAAAGVTAPFQEELPGYIDDSIFIIKSTATYLSEERMAQIRSNINSRPTTQMNKIAELAALELVPCGSIDDHELKRLRNYAIDLVRCCREIQRDPTWEWGPPPGGAAKGSAKKKKHTKARELTQKEKFQLALNPHSTIGEIARQNTINEQKRAVSGARHRTLEESDSDSGASFMSETNFQEDETKSNISDADVARIKSVFSVSGSGTKSNLDGSGEEEEKAASDEETGGPQPTVAAALAEEPAQDTAVVPEATEVDSKENDTKPPPKKTVVPKLLLGKVSSDFTSAHFSVRSEDSFDMAAVYDKSLSFQDVSNPSAGDAKKTEALKGAAAVMDLKDSSSDESSSSSPGASDVDDFDDPHDDEDSKRDKPTPAAAKSPKVPRLGLDVLNSPSPSQDKSSQFMQNLESDSGFSGAMSFSTAQVSSLSNFTADTEDNHVYRVTDDKPTPVAAKSPKVPRLGLDVLNSPSPPQGKLSQVAQSFGSDSDYSDSDEDDDEFSSSNVQSLAGMVSLGSGRLNPPARTSFGSAGRPSFGSAGSDVGVESVLAPAGSGNLSARGPSPRYTSPRPPLASPRQGYAVASPRDEDFPAASKPHRRTSKHSLVPEGHEHVSVLPPVRSSGMVPVPHIYSSNENRSESR